MRDQTELIRPMKQKVWGWPAVANFILGGMAGGCYLLVLLLAIARADAPGMGISGLLAAMLVASGFLVLTLEAGRPARNIYLLRHLRRSWMSRETLAALIFVPAAALGGLVPFPGLWLVAGVAAIGLVVSQGFIVYRARAVTAWNVASIPLVFVTSGLAAGCGLILLQAVVAGAAVDRALIAVGLICAALDLVVWLAYLHSPDGDFRKATQALRKPSALIQVVGFGRLLPMLLLVLASFSAIGSSAMPSLLAAPTAMALIAGSIAQKTGLIIKAGYLRGIVLGPSHAPIGNIDSRRESD